MSHHVFLLVVLLICHYLADFCFTWKGLIRSKADGKSLFPIFIHAGIHALLMGGCLMLYDVELTLLLMLVAMELISHFLIDVLKAKVSIKFIRMADMKRKSYWMLYGADQLLHQFVVVLIWYIVIF